MRIAPWLSVSDGSAALAWYVAAFGAIVRERVDGGDQIQVARLALDDAEFWIAHDPDQRPDGRVPVRMILTVDDPDARFAKALTQGAKAVAPMADSHGWRVGRVVDPFGHHWEIGKPIGQPRTDESRRDEERRVSKLAVLPLWLSVAGWIALAIAIGASVPLFLYNAEALLGPLYVPMWIVAVAGWFGAGSLSLAAMASGGVSWLRVHRDRDELRGRGLAAAGCFAAVPPLAVSAMVVLLPLGTVVAFVVYVMIFGFHWM